MSLKRNRTEDYLTVEEKRPFRMQSDAPLHIKSLPLQLQHSLRVKVNTQNTSLMEMCIKVDDFKKYFTNLVNLNSGANGTVFSADVTPLGRLLDSKMPSKIAIKKISVDVQNQIPLLLNEIALLKSIRTPHTIAYYGCYINTNILYLVMELVPGEDLFTSLDEWNIEEKLTIAREIAMGIKEIHDLGIAHRDIKLENVMVSDVVKIIDFGLSCDGRGDVRKHTCTKLNIGTPGYIDPKLLDTLLPSLQLSDWWAYGQMMVTLFTGLSLWTSQNIYVRSTKADFLPTWKKLMMDDETIPQDELSVMRNDFKSLVKILLKLTDPEIPQRDRPGQAEIMAALNLNL